MAEIQNLIDSIPAGICLFSKNNAKITCIAANRTFIDMIGAEEDTLTGKSFDYFIEKIHPEELLGPSGTVAPKKVLFQLTVLFRVLLHCS